jgi:periplasmic protein TonB
MGWPGAFGELRSSYALPPTTHPTRPMSHADHQFDTDTVPAPYRQDQLSANAHWIFGSIYAGLALVGFGFGVWAGAAKPKPAEVAEKKEPEKPGDKPAPKPNVNPAANPTNPNAGANPAVEPKPKDPGGDKPSGMSGDKPSGTSGDKPAPKTGGTAPGTTTTPGTPPGKSTPVVTKVVTFKEVQPILKANCNECHGDTKGKPNGDVDTRTLANIMKSKGPPLVVGKPMDSTLYLSVKSDDMPPDPRKKLTDEQKQLLHDWIAGGAKERRRTIRGRRGVPPAGRREVG